MRAAPKIGETPCSGVSWAVNAGVKKINLINNWPNPAGRIANSDKVPSLITYKDRKPDKWGYNVKLSAQSFEWIKALLEPELRSENKGLGKAAEEQYTVDHIKRDQGQDFETIYKTSIMLTVPTMWSPTTKDRTLRAAKIAGMSPNTALVTEPEAAALSTLKDKEGIVDLKKGDAFVICDAGGGTVDLISYRVIRIEPLQVEECVVGVGEFCGSVFLDSEFEKYISTIVGETAYLKIREDNRKKMLQEFEYGIKRAFCDDAEEPYSVDLKGVKDDSENGIFDGTIEVTGYGIKMRFPFDKTKHLPEDRWAHPADGTVFASNQIHWLVRREIPTVSPVDRTKGYRLLEKTTEIVLRNADLDFGVLYKGELVGHCVVS
ncbi:hypothetical protein AOQ84DRAFT_415939 [Glonium stellatum]|uniref:Actin-like ATPase domain-containing protein n=1 Tax=Glonium stellatum TaxID=574774 RepID=A0A8E2ETJ3_9PEZI|nr:hypothetical protein AOQ84DRAFT_415939 [Glonium stellatum]